MGEYKPSAALGTLHPATTKSVTLGTAPLEDQSACYHPSEARFWCQKYGLGPRALIRSYSSSKKLSAPRKLKFDGPSSSNAVISQLVFAPAPVGYSYSSSSSSLQQQQQNHQLAVVSGPRIGLYGGRTVGGGGLGGVTSAFNRALSQSFHHLLDHREGEDDDDDGDDDDDKEEKKEKTIKADRLLGTSGHPAHCAAYRRDGRLIAIGAEDGCVRVCDVTTRATLRTLGGSGKGHAVRTVGWLRDGKRIISGGDDGVVRIWDISGGMGGVGGGGITGGGSRPLLAMRGHADAVRACVIVNLARREEKKKKSSASNEPPVWQQLAVSGGYDHTVRVWDLDDLPSTEESHDEMTGERCLAVMDHGAPVEALLLIPDPSLSDDDQDEKLNKPPLILSAGGTTIKIWNPITAKCLSTIRPRHSKTITSVCLITIQRDISIHHSSELATILERRIITGGLDGLVRIHILDDTLTLPAVHGMKLSQPITALTSSPDGRRLVMGTSNGQIVLHQRAPLPTTINAVIESRKRKKEPRAGTYAFFTRGANVEADADDYVALMEKKRRLGPYDVALRQFRYSDALDEALGSRQPQAVIAVLEELGKRRGLKTALSNRDEEALEPILSFVVRYITQPRYTPLLVGVADMLCDIYGNVIGQSEIIDELFDKLRKQVKSECKIQRSLLMLLGQIDAAMTAAET